MRSSSGWLAAGAMAAVAVYGWQSSSQPQQTVMAPGHQPPGAPLPRYVYNVVAADFSVASGQPLSKSKFNLYDPVGPTVEQFDNNIAKMGELNVDTYRIELGWGRARTGFGTHAGVGGTADKLAFDFGPLDHLVRGLKTQDVQLLGSFCYTPAPLQDPALPQRYGEGELKRKDTTPPRDLGKWKEAVTAFVKHYKEIGIPFGVNEVWNEPDGTYGFFSGSPAEYEQLFKAAAEGIREADPDAVVAGPGADHHILWNTSFIDFVYKNKLPLDYYSFHEYGSGELAVRQVERTGGSLNRYPYFNTTALSLDEWHDGECCNWCNDDVRNRYEGAPEMLYDFKLLLGRPELASVSWAWWQDPDRRGASGRAPRTAGCMGLVTGDGRRKAVFNAWKAYARMPVDRRQVTVEGALEALASSDAHRASLLLWNPGSYDRRVDVHLKNLPFKTGTVRIYRIDSKHASPVDGADENLTAQETYPLAGGAEWAWLDGQLPKYGTLYVEADDGSGASDLAPAKVGNVVRVNRYYPARGKTASYADFDRKTWMPRLGMMDDRAADQRIGVLAGGLPDALAVDVKVEGKLQKTGPDSLLGVRLDYRVKGKYVKAVLMHGPYGGIDLFEHPPASMPWGLKAQLDDTVAVPGLASFKIPLKAMAPAGWNGEVHLAFLMRGAGRGASARFTVRPAGN